MSARADVAEALRAGLFGWKVYASPKVPDGLSTNAVVVYRETVTNQVTYDSNTLAVWVLDPHQDAPDDPLDEALSQVLAVLNAQPNLTWSTAERGVYADVWPAYNVTVTVTTTKE